MIWSILLYLSLGFLILRFVVTLINFVTRPYLHKSNLAQNGLVSVLIPARNEERQIEKTIRSVLDQDYEDFELWVLDDNSTDNTANIVSEVARRDPRVHLINGKELPEGWLGKNWACQQLSLVAKGEFMLFIDADVVLKDGSIGGAIAEMITHKLSLLSVFPDQEIVSLGEQMVVPLMNWLLLSLLPLKLVMRSLNPAFSAANGQFMLFDGDQYRVNSWHEQVKSQVVEDVEIMKTVKSKGQKAEVLLANGLVNCRMYSSYQESIQGFSKNLLAGFGNFIPGLLLFLWLTMLSLPLVMVASNEVTIWQGLLFTGLVALIRSMVSVLSGQKVIQNLLLHVLQMTTLFFLGFYSIYKYLSRTAEWKGRPVNI